MGVSWMCYVYVRDKSMLDMVKRLCSSILRVNKGTFKKTMKTLELS